jgi:PPM family protein phosphatase
MELMTSGAFARASGLSRKALRLYEELGLLRPIQVDQASQYRLYSPAQLEQARLGCAGWACPSPRCGR